MHAHACGVCRVWRGAQLSGSTSGCPGGRLVEGNFWHPLGLGAAQSGQGGEGESPGPRVWTSELQIPDLCKSTVWPQRGWLSVSLSETHGRIRTGSEWRDKHWALRCDSQAVGASCVFLQNPSPPPCLGFLIREMGQQPHTAFAEDYVGCRL